MNTYARPGVYVEELPGPQLISPVSSSNTAFIGLTEKGPVNSPTLITSWNAYVAQFGGFQWGAQTAFSVFSFFSQGGAICYIVRAGTTGTLTPATTKVDDLTISAASGGTWGNSLAIMLTNSPPEQPRPSATPKPIFAIDVLYKLPEAGATPTLHDQLIAKYAASNAILPVTYGGEQYYPLESYAGLSKRDMDTGQDGTLQAPIETRINSSSLFIRVKVDDGSTERPSENIVAPELLAGGDGDSASAPIDVPVALETLNTVENISLLVAPETAMIEDVGKQRDVAEEYLNYCEKRPRKDLFAILDTPYGLKFDDAVKYKSGEEVGTAEAGVALHSSYGAIYYPWIEILDTTTTMNLVTPPSGAMAGTYANADQLVGPWQSPAGVTYGALNVATGVETVVTPTQQDVLNPAGVNAILPKTGFGILSYGARTLSQDPSLVYIAVRRLLIEIEVSLYNGLQWVVFEPNTPKLWGSVTRDVTEFLKDMWRQGALVGQKESEAFKVQCNADNNPVDQQRKGQLHVDIGVAPAYPAEFVIVRIQQTTMPS